MKKTQTFKMIFLLCFLILFGAAVEGYSFRTSDGNLTKTQDEMNALNFHNQLELLFPPSIWPNATVLFELNSSSLTENDKLIVAEGMKEIETKTCVNFRPRNEGEEDYTIISVDNEVCGISNIFKRGGQQFNKIGGSCRTKSVMVHELLHTLCFGHEHQRPDRDKYLQFGECESPPEKMSYDTKGYPYDYASQTHETCGTCVGGWPKVEGNTECGDEITSGLSVMDADKINELYGCQGCYSHRWRPIDNLTKEDIDNLVLFNDDHDNLTQTVYICRALDPNANIRLGKYFLDSGFCQFYHSPDRKLHNVTFDAQVLTMPYHQESKQYRLTSFNKIFDRNGTQYVNNNKYQLIPVGNFKKWVGYLGSSILNQENGSRVRGYGAMYLLNVKDAFSQLPTYLNGTVVPFEKVFFVTCVNNDD